MAAGRIIGGGAALAALAAAAFGYRSFAAAMAEARRRIASASGVASSRFGRVEYALAGSGPPLLVIHGAGGGFDQGLTFGERAIAAGRAVIAPSRFGYLGSDFPEDASSENQADALADLLDELGVDRLPVLGGSAGALAAIHFALRHPDRCAALVLLVPAAFSPEQVLTRPSPARARMMDAALRSNFAFWALIRFAPDLLIGSILATDPALVGRAHPAERARVHRMLREILPVSRRRLGLLNDARLTSDPSPAHVEDIAAPTLILSAEDDRYGTAAIARALGARIPGAETVVYPDGGHLCVGRDHEVWERIERFLENVADDQPAGRAGAAAGARTSEKA